MRSYQEWRQLNESLGGPVILGVHTPPSLGLVGSRTTEEALQALEEAKKKLKKKMFGDMGDDEGGDDEGDGDKLALLKKKKGGDDDDAGDDDDGGDDDDAGDDGDDGDDDAGDDDAGDGKPSFLKKKKSVKVSDEEDADDDAENDTPFMKKKAKKKMAKKMTKEDADWLADVQAMMNVSPDPKYWDGIVQPVSEDSLLPPNDPNAQVTDAQPGDVGFAPQGRVGEIR